MVHPPMTYTPPDSPTKGSTTSPSLPGNHTLVHRLRGARSQSGHDIPESLSKHLCTPTSPSSCCCSPTRCTSPVCSALPAFARLLSWQDAPLTGHGSFPILPFPAGGGVQSSWWEQADSDHLLGADKAESLSWQQNWRARDMVLVGKYQTGSISSLNTAMEKQMEYCKNFKKKITIIFCISISWCPLRSWLLD